MLAARQEKPGANEASEGGIARSMLNAACPCSTPESCKPPTRAARPLPFFWDHRRLCKVASIVCSDALLCLMMLTVPEPLGGAGRHSEVAATGNCMN